MKNIWPINLGLSAILAAGFGLASCGSVPYGPSGAPQAATVAYVWGSNYPTFDGGPPQTILQYSTLSPQASSPVGTLTLPPSCNGGPIATDYSGQLYVACFSPSSSPWILVYPPNSAGAATPTRTIEVGSSSYEIATLTVDSRGELYVGSLKPGDQVQPFELIVYSATASGTAVPERVIELKYDLWDVATNAAGNIYVLEYNDGAPASLVDVYPADGSAQPIRSISFPFFAYGIGADAHGDIFVSASEQVGNTWPFTAILEYAPDATGYATSTNTINLPAQAAGMSVGGGPVRFDSAGNLFAAIRFGAPYEPGSFALYRLGPPYTGQAIPVAETTPSGYNAVFALH